MIPNRDKEREYLSKKADEEENKETVSSISCDICQNFRDATREEHKPLEAISNAMAEYEKDFSRPNTIKINRNTLNKLKVQVKYGAELENIETVLGMRIEIDYSLKDNVAIIYDDKNIYTKLQISPPVELTLEDCQKAIDTIKDTNSNPIMFPSEVKTLKDFNCRGLSDLIICSNRDKLVIKQDLKEEVKKSLKRVNDSKMWDLIERVAINIWAKNFFNLKDEELR